MILLGLLGVAMMFGGVALIFSGAIYGQLLIVAGWSLTTSMQIGIGGALIAIGYRAFSAYMHDHSWGG